MRNRKNEEPDELRGQAGEVKSGSGVGRSEDEGCAQQGGALASHPQLEGAERRKKTVKRRDRQHDVATGTSREPMGASLGVER